MNKTKTFLYLLLALTFTLANLNAQSWKLVWSDEFDGTYLDESKWEYMIGDGTSYGLPSGWGNNELQWYTDDNITIENGILIIAAEEQSMSGKDYTSSRIRTMDTGDWKYGKFEIRAKMPIGQGIWPALWMLPTNNEYGGWAASGEIDIIEYLGQEPNTVLSTLHYGGEWPANTYRQRKKVLSEGTFHESFHIFAFEWEEGKMRCYVDGEQFGSWSSWYTTADADFPAPFDQKFHLLLNLAVGGNLPGSPDATTEFPQQLEIDYVRVYQIDSTTAVEDEIGLLPTEHFLGQNYPNPFNPSTTVKYSIPNVISKNFGSVQLKIYDTLGKEVATLVNEQQNPGSYEVSFNADDLPSGMYLYRMNAGNFFDVKKMLLLK